LELERVETKIDLDVVELFYNNRTMKDVNKLVKKIKKSQTGISILYGERGTGKTSIIHYLANKLDRIVIFVPNNMLESTINNPDFRKFIKKYNKVLLVLDDCEMSFNEYFVKSNFIVNNLLQLVDGFLSDSVDLSIVTIFNVEDSEEIDHNLLNSNNLIDIIHFDELSEAESNELSDHLGDKTKYKNKAKLIDIIKKRKVLGNKKLGF
jgi:AAA+ ATPase superfamily predicted ATPase